MITLLPGVQIKPFPVQILVANIASRSPPEGFLYTLPYCLGNPIDRLPQEIRDKIFAYIKVVHTEKNLVLTDFIDCPRTLRHTLLLTKVRYKGQFNTDIFNAMRVCHRWYQELYLQGRSTDLTFKEEWTVIKAMESLLKLSEKRAPKIAICGRM